MLQFSDRNSKFPTEEIIMGARNINFASKLTPNGVSLVFSRQKFARRFSDGQKFRMDNCSPATRPTTLLSRRLQIHVGLPSFTKTRKMQVPDL